MTQDLELLQFISKNAEMGKASLTHALDAIDDLDFRETVKDQIADYDEICAEADDLIDRTGAESESAGAFAKTMADMMFDMKTLTDDSPSKMSEMMIQGNSMGIVKMTERLNEFDGNPEIAALAKKHIAYMQENIDVLKAYL